MAAHVRFVELPVDDQERAVRFYTDKLGFYVAQDRDYKPRWRWLVLGIPGAQTGILLTRRDGERPEVPRLVLTVDDVPGLFHELVAKGVEFVDEPDTAPWDDAETYAVFRDSEGNLVMIGSRSVTQG